MGNQDDYKDRIQRALNSREKTAQLLETVWTDRFSLLRKNRKRDLAQLREIQSAEELLRHPSLASMLPLLIAVDKNDHAGILKQLDRLRLMESPGESSLRSPFSISAISWLAGLVLLIFQAYFISPTFEKMFFEFELRLPRSTEFCFAINRLLRAIGPVLVVMFFFVWYFAGKIRDWCQGFLFRHQSWPFVGLWMAGRSSNLRSTSAYIASLAELLTLDAPLEDAAFYAAIASRSPLLIQSSSLLPHYVRKTQLPLDSQFRFPMTLVAALRQAGDRQSSIEFLRDLSRTYAHRVHLRQQLKQKKASPWGIVAAGAFILFVVFTLFMPQVSLISGLA